MRGPSPSPSQQARPGRTRLRDGDVSHPRAPKRCGQTTHPAPGCPGRPPVLLPCRSQPPPAPGIREVVPQPSGQIGPRPRRGSRVSRPPGFDAEAYKQRNTVERCMCATRRLVVSPAQPGGIGGIFLGLMAHLDPKGAGDQSMPENQRPGSVARDGALRGPRDKAKAGLPEPQSPVDESSHPSERLLKPMPCPVTALMHGRHTFRDMGRCPVRTLKEMSGAPTSRYDVQQGRTWDRLRGANPRATECS